MKVTLFGYISRDRNILPSGETSEIVGGKGLFGATALSRSGIEVELVTWLPENDLGLLSELNNLGITIHVIPMDVGVATTNTHTDDVTIATSTSDPKPITIADITEDIRQAIVTSDVVLFMPEAEHKVPIDVIRYISHDLGLTVFADIGKYFRKTETDETLTPQYPWPRQAEFLSSFTTVFLSAEDVQAAIDQGESILSLARTMAEEGPAEVVITEGSKGAWVFSRETNELIHVEVYPPKNIVDPTGAGDTFIGAYVAEHLRSDDIHASGRFASMAASLSLNYSGPLRESATEINAKLKEIGETAKD